MNTHHIQVSRTARYYTQGALTEKTKRIWIVVHGFGQMAGTFLKEFEPMQSEEDFFVAPEALNRFYSKGASGNVGATWMTREDRLNEIKDYCHYLDALYSAIVPINFQGEIIALGFSQGASTVTRWVDSSANRFHKMVDYAGEVGAELLPLKDDSGLRQSKNYIIFGTQDEFFNREIVSAMLEKYAPLQAEVVQYEGNHSIDCDILKKVK